MTVQGIDVSRWQGEMNWQTAANAGVKFAFIKATQGTSIIDGQFVRNWAESQRAGIYRGAYHFYDARYQPLGQAQHFYNTVNPAGLSVTLPPVCDFEVDGVPSATLKQFLDEVERLFGIKPIIYTSVRYWYTTPPAWTGDYMLWVANWTTGAPMLPPGWDSWVFHQYSADGNGLGATYGAQSNSIDLNWFNGTTEDLSALAGDDMTDPIPPPSLPEWGIVVSKQPKIYRAVSLFSEANWWNTSIFGQIDAGATVKIVGEKFAPNGDKFYEVQAFIPASRVEPLVE